MQTYQVFGASLHQGSMENGVSYDFAKLFILTELTTGDGKKMGFTVVSQRADSKCFEALKGQRFPVDCALEFKLSLAGQGEGKTLVTSCVPRTAGASGKAA